MMPALIVPSVRPVVMGANPATTAHVGDSFQLVFRQYNIGGGYTDTSAGVSWLSSNSAVLTVDSNGVVRFVGTGSAAVTGTLGGNTATLTYTVSSAIAITAANEITAWRAAVTGGDIALPLLYSVLANTQITTSNGLVTSLGDARGNGFGPALVPVQGNVALLGSGPSDWRLRPDGAGGVLRSAAAVAAANAGGPFTMVFIGTDEQGGVPFDVEDPSDVNAAGASFYMSTSNGAISATVAPWNGIWPSPPDGNSAQGSPSLTSGKIRVVLLKCDGAGNVFLKVGLLPPETRSGATAIPSRNLKVAVGGLVQNALYAPNRIRAAAMVGHLTSSTEDIAIHQLAATYHGAVCTGRYIVVFDGDSNTRGHGLTKISDNTSTVLMNRASWVAWDDPNTAIDGAQVQSGGTSSLLDNYATKVRPLLQNASSGGKKVVVLGNGAGGNDLDSTSGHNTGALAWADMKAYNTLVQADGGVLVVTTPLPRVVVSGVQATYNTERANLRTQILANAATSGIKVADLGGDAAFSSNTPSATYFQVDNLHLNIAGHLKCADLTEAVLATI